MRYRFILCDVFSRARFGGNQLAVLPEAEGLTGEQMQSVAREFNFSESTFVLPAEHGYTRRVRIFTPRAEIPFAGHPNIGTAFTLVHSGTLGRGVGSLTVTFEERAGVVPIAIDARDRDAIRCELTAPEALEIGRRVSPQAVAQALSLDVSDVLLTHHEPQVVSVGLPFVMVELRDRAALERADINITGFKALAEKGVPPDIHLYVRQTDDFDLRTRMFAPLDGVLEDPATGSANCGLVGLLAHLDEAPDLERSWRIAQGVEMGRPSVLEASAEKRDGRVVATRVGGHCAWVGEGEIEI